MSSYFSYAYICTCFNDLSGIGFGDRHYQLLSSFDISGINMSIFCKDECVFMTEYVFVAIVEKRSFIFLRSYFTLRNDICYVEK